MPDIKFQVFIAAEESTDKKTTIVNLKRIRIYNEDVWYHIPEDFQKVSAYHTALAAVGPVKSALNAIKNRGHYRTVKVTVSQEIAGTYLDSDENFVFRGLMLEEVVVGTTNYPSDPKMAELALCLQRFKPPESVKDILEHFLVEKFSPKNRNVKAWCELFEKESSRFNLTGTKQIEVFKSCLDPTMSDWFAVGQRKLSISADWEQWKELLVSTYADSSWKPIRYAYLFKHLSGSLLDYAVKKERMLLELDRDLPQLVILDLIVVGLPNHIQNSLNRNTINSIQELYNKLKKYEAGDKDLPSNQKFSNFKNSLSNKNTNTNPTSKNFEKKNNVIKKPCSICAGKGFDNRYHPEASCWNKVIKKATNYTEAESPQSSGEEAKNE